eukprot:14924148-Ditylum_brightwellii.AAC.1
MAYKQGQQVMVWIDCKNPLGWCGNQNPNYQWTPAVATHISNIATTVCFHILGPPFNKLTSLTDIWHTVQTFSLAYIKGLEGDVAAGI